MKIRYAPLAVACALMVAAAATTTAQAAAVTYYFGGKLDSVSVSSLAVGNTFAGSFTFESTAVDVFTSGSFGSTYGVYDASFAIDVTVNGLSFSSSSSTSDCPACGGVQVSNNESNGADYFFALSEIHESPATVAGPSLDGYPPFSLSVSLSNQSGAVFSSDALPSTLALSSFDNSNFFFRSGAIGAGPTASGSLTYLSTTAPVPEASTSAMLALGLGALAVVRRRKGS